MTAIAEGRHGSLPRPIEMEISAPAGDAAAEALAELKRAVHAALETYSNVHRGSGHYSQASTHLYEQAREIVLDHLGLHKDRYQVVFCSPQRAEALKAQLRPGLYHCLSSQDMGLALGVRALAVESRALPRGAPDQAGGGTARLVSPGWVIWARGPVRFEAGTPAIVNVIAFAKALRLSHQFGAGVFQSGQEKPADTPEQVAAEILYQDDLEPYAGIELLHALRGALIGGSGRVPTAEGARPYINLDNAASTPTFTPIWEAAWRAWRQPRVVQQAMVQEVTSICARLLGAPSAAYQVLFTANTTEAINLVAESLAQESERGVKPVVLNTLLEHNSNELPWRQLPGASLVRLPVDAEGFVDLDELEGVLAAHNQVGRHGKKRVKLVTVNGASNVLGVFNDLAAISRIVHRYGARLLVDAAQLVAHRPVDMEQCGIDYLAFSAHKVYAPFGSGALVARKGLLKFSPEELALIRSSGEENAGGIAALGKALALLQRIGLDVIQEEEQALTAQALRGLAQIPGLRVYGVKDPDSPRFARKGGVIVFGLNGAMAPQVARELAEQGGIGVRYGCHCAHLLIKRLVNIPPALELFQGVIVTLFPRVSLPGLTRVSLGIENTPEEIDALVQVLDKIARQPRTEVDRPFASTQTDGQRQMESFAMAAAQRVYSITSTTSSSSSTA